LYYCCCAAKTVKGSIRWGVARSSRARFFFYFIAPRSCRTEPCTSAELPDATKQTKNRVRLHLAAPQCWLAFNKQGYIHASYHVAEWQFLSIMNRLLIFSTDISGILGGLI